MNEMYTMSIGIHDFGVFAFLAVVSLNLLILIRADEIYAYAKRMRILMPISASMIATVIFTGAVMMAAKRLDFTIENLVMIIFSVALIVLEAKRYASLKHSDLTIEGIFALYRAKAVKILLFELIVTLLITVWMFVR